MMLSPGGPKPPLTDDRVRELMIDGLKRIVGYGAGKGIRVSIENHGGLSALRGGVRHMIQFVESVPGLELTYDIGNYILAAEDPLDAFRATADHVIHIHIKDYVVIRRRDRKKPHLFCPDGGSYKPSAAGCGVAPLQELAVLLATGRVYGEAGNPGLYTEYLSIEYEGDNPTSADAVTSSITRVREIFGGCG